MKTTNEINVGGVLVVFQMSLEVGTITSSPPTEFTRNYLETLVKIAGEHFVKQMAESIIERLHEDFSEYPKDKLWKIKS